MTSTPLGVNLVDVSQYQDPASVPWAAFVRFGVKGAYIKATEGTGYADPAYKAHRANAAPHGIPVGAYHFAHTDEDALTQAQFFLNIAQPRVGDLRPMLDLEVNKGQLDIVALTKFRDTILSTWGGHLHITSNVLYSQFDYTTTGNNILMRAAYSGTPQNNGNWYVPQPPKPFKQWDIWQFSDGVYGNPNEVAGDHIDLSTFRKGFTIDDLKIPAPAKTPAPKPVVKSGQPASKWAPALQRIQYHGITTNQMTAHALLEVQRMVDHSFVYYRGSYCNGTTSAGTDKGGGHVDISLVGISDATARKWVKALRIKGFMAYLREEIPGYWPRHIHCILIGDPDISAPAAKQVVEYKQGRNALADNGPDPDWRPHVIWGYQYPPTAQRIARDEAYYRSVEAA